MIEVLLRSLEAGGGVGRASIVSNGLAYRDVLVLFFQGLLKSEPDERVDVLSALDVFNYSFLIPFRDQEVAWHFLRF